jgi:hypothetical protein
VTALVTIRAPRGEALAGVELGWSPEPGRDVRVPVAEAWSVPFESGRPVRRFTSHKGQRHLSGLWWCATTGGHVGFESWLERDELVALDFDATVTGLASQPFWLSWTDRGGERFSHAPDYFARRGDGSVVVVDCRPVELRRVRDVTKFEATAQVCEQLGWDYGLVGAVDPIRSANLRWLAGYRHPRHWVSSTVEAVRAVFAAPAPLMAGAEAVGDPIGVLPVLFHLLWCRELVADLSVPLAEHTAVATGVGS